MLESLGSIRRKLLSCFSWNIFQCGFFRYFLKQMVYENWSRIENYIHN